MPTPQILTKLLVDESQALEFVLKQQLHTQPPTPLQSYRRNRFRIPITGSTSLAFESSYLRMQLASLHTFY